MALASVLLVVLRDLPLVAGFLPSSNPVAVRLLLQPRPSPSSLPCATLARTEPCPRSAGSTLATAVRARAGSSTFPAVATAPGRREFSWQTRRTCHDRATTSLCSGSSPGSISSAPASDNRSSSPPAERLADEGGEGVGGGGGGGAGSAPSAVVAAEEEKQEQEEEGASDSSSSINSSSTWGTADLIDVGLGEGRDRAGAVEQALGYELEWEAGAPWTEFEDWLVQDTFSR